MSAATTTAKRKSGNFFDWYKEQPTVIQVGLPVGAFLLIRGISNNISARQAAMQYSNTAGAESSVWAQQGERLTFPKSQYLTWADQIEEAMQYMGTYPDTIADIISNCKNNLDVLELVKAFGTRDIYFFGGANSYTLPQALRDELSEGWMKEINEGLASKGITYRF